MRLPTPSRAGANWIGAAVTDEAQRLVPAPLHFSDKFARPPRARSGGARGGRRVSRSLQDLRLEGVAVLGLATGQATAEPLCALQGRSVREVLGHDVTAGALL